MIIAFSLCSGVPTCMTHRHDKSTKCLLVAEIRCGNDKTVN